MRCLAGVAGLKCVGETGLPNQILAAVLRLKVDVLVLSGELVQQEANDLLERLTATDRGPAILVLASNNDASEADRFLQRGALGFLAEADADASTLVNAVRRVAEGEVALSPKLFTEVLSNRRRSKLPVGNPVELLSPRELEVFHLTGAGLEAKQIAQRLSLSARTVDVHRANIRNKLGLRGIHELMRYAMHWTEDHRQGDLLRRFSQGKRPMLLVEDDEVDVLSVQRALEELRIGGSLVVARTGEEGLAYLRSSQNPRPCLILLDLSMPRMNGHEFLAELRQDPALASLPVVVLTSSQQEEDNSRMYALGLAGYLLKPTTSAEFLEMFRTLVQYWAINEPPPAAA